jgi:hypothetical protein
MRTVHTLARMDVVHPTSRVDAVDRAFLDARPVQYVHARLSDHAGHRNRLRAPWTPHIGSGQSVHTVRQHRPLQPARHSCDAHTRTLIDPPPAGIQPGDASPPLSSYPEGAIGPVHRGSDPAMRGWSQTVTSIGEVMAT